MTEFKSIIQMAKERPDCTLAPNYAVLWYHIKYSSTKQQKAMKLPNMIPSLLFFEPIFPIRVLTPGI